jgi:hypothetical protein
MEGRWEKEKKWRREWKENGTEEGVDGVKWKKK